MPMTRSMVGLRGPSAADTLEDRWVSNYAAAVGDTNPVYYDNRVATPLPAHAAYVSHLEWDAIGLLHAAHLGALTPDERVRGVHIFNSTRLHRPLIAGDVLAASASVVGVERHRAGAKMTIRIDTVDAQQRSVATSYTATIFRGVELDAEAAPPASDLGAAARSAQQPTRTQDIAITGLAPYVFSECARDYGAIHTDMKVAAKAGLPGLILHGTGTIAYVLSALTNHEAGGDPGVVRGFQARLSGMVLCPSVMTLRVFRGDDPGAIHFDVLTDRGDTALSHGIVILGRPQ